ncbi:MAG: phage major capsid protein [Thauera sp.]|nr:phage major capsid protein [Thauera sp.]
MSSGIQAQREVVAKHIVEVEAELAKQGIQLEGGDSRKELVSHRADIRRAVNVVRERQTALASKSSTWSDKDQREYERNSNLMSAMGAIIEIDNITLALMSHDEPRGGSSSESWKGSKGELRILGRSDRLGSAGALTPNFGFGEFVASMVRGSANPDIRASLTEGTDSAGGYTVPDHLMAEVIDAMRSKTVVIQAGALTVPLDTEKTTIARLESDPVAGWRFELGNVANGDPTFGAVTFQARSLACLVKISRELLEDSANIDSALVNAFAGAMAGELDRVALFGTGIAPEPRGVFNTGNVLSVSMGQNGGAISGYGKLLDALYELENANANPPSAMVMSPRTSRAFNGLTDNTGQPLNAPEPVRAVPRFSSTIVPVNQGHGTATNASSIICGDFSRLLIGIRTVLRIDVLKETFASTMEYGFLAHLRADIAVATPKAFVVVKGVIP